MDTLDNKPPEWRSYDAFESEQQLMNSTSISGQLVPAWQPHGLPSNGHILNATASYGLATTGMSDCEDYYEFYDNARFVTGLICYPIICILGLAGNFLILLVLSQKTMRTSTNIYLSALAVSDIIKLINDLLYFLTVLLSKLHPPTGEKMFGYLYPYAHFIFNMAVCIAAWLTVSVAVERYILVCHPTRSKGVITISRAKIISALCYIVMTALAIPSAFRYETVTLQTINEQGQNVTKYDVELSQLWKQKQFVISYTWMQSLLRSIIPLFILVVMNAFIINALRKTRANKKNASRNRITVMLIIVIIFFLFCITPDAIMSAFFNFGYTESNHLVKGIREITDLLLAVNAAINFALYLFFNKIFRDQFLNLFCKNRKTERRKNGVTNESKTTDYTPLQLRTKSNNTISAINEQHYSPQNSSSQNV